jgi:spermidine/putrescine transport system substrate-binding protein
MKKNDFSKNELIDRLLSGKMTRRQYLQAISAAGLSMAMVQVPRRASAAVDQATYFTWGGYDDPEMFKPYIAKHGVPPNFSVFGDSEEGLTKMRAGFIVDVSHPCNASLPRWVATGLFQPIDPDKLSNWSDVIPTLTNLQGANQDGKQFFAPMEWGQTSVTYRTDLFELQGEESWAMLWDERYKGKLSMIGSAGDSFWCASIFAGVPFEEADTTENFKKVNDLLRKQRPLVRLYTNDLTTVEQALASGELVAGMTWNDSAVNLKGQGVPVKFADPKEGALTWVCGMVLHRDAPHRDKAHDVIDSLLDPEVGAYIIDTSGYGHCNPKSFQRLPPERIAELGLTTNPSDMLNRGHFQISPTQEFETKINREFEEIMAGF